MSVPSRGECYARLVEFLRKAQEESAMLAHLHSTESSDKDKSIAMMWLVVEDQLKKLVHSVTLVAQGRLQ